MYEYARCQIVQNKCKNKFYLYSVQHIWVTMGNKLATLHLSCFYLVDYDF